jgi:hypothetical protein
MTTNNLDGNPDDNPHNNPNDNDKWHQLQITALMTTKMTTQITTLKKTKYDNTFRWKPSRYTTKRQKEIKTQMATPSNNNSRSQHQTTITPHNITCHLELFLLDVIWFVIWSCCHLVLSSGFSSRVFVCWCWHLGCHLHCRLNCHLNCLLSLHQTLFSFGVIFLIVIWVVKWVSCEVVILYCHLSCHLCVPGLSSELSSVVVMQSCYHLVWSSTLAYEVVVTWCCPLGYHLCCHHRWHALRLLIGWKLDLLPWLLHESIMHWRIWL